MDGNWNHFPIVLGISMGRDENLDTITNRKRENIWVA